jgi:hypothetical protein
MKRAMRFNDAEWLNAMEASQADFDQSILKVLVAACGFGVSGVSLAHYKARFVVPKVVRPD